MQDPATPAWSTRCPLKRHSTVSPPDVTKAIHTLDLRNVMLCVRCPPALLYLCLTEMGQVGLCGWIMDLDFSFGDSLNIVEWIQYWLLLFGFWMLELGKLWVMEVKLPLIFPIDCSNSVMEHFIWNLKVFFLGLFSKRLWGKCIGDYIFRAKGSGHCWVGLHKWSQLNLKHNLNTCD